MYYINMRYGWRKTTGDTKILTPGIQQHSKTIHGKWTKSNNSDDFFKRANHLVTYPKVANSPFWSKFLVQIKPYNDGFRYVKVGGPFNKPFYGKYVFRREKRY